MTTVIATEIKSEKIHLRITPSQKETWRALAEAQGVSWLLGLKIKYR